MLLFSYFVLLLSCVARCYHRTADTRRAGFSPNSILACARTSSDEVCTLYLVFKEPRTLLPFPRGRVIQSLGFSPGPFWGNLSNLRRLSLPCQSFFSLHPRYFWTPLSSRSAPLWSLRTARILPGSRDALDREHRVVRVY